MKLRCANLLLVVLTFAVNAAAAQGFMAGADLSLLTYFESNGITYKSNGQAGDAIGILKNQGINCIRLRLFTSSAAQAQNDPYNYLNNLAYTVPLAVRVKSAGLKLLLDFHYSDTWADPGHQAIPTAWTNLTFTQLVQQMHDYNSNCIAAFKAAGALPDCVQVGNEITSGFLWPVGEVGGSYETPAQWSQFAQLLTAAIQGIKDAAGASPPQIVIHIDRGGDWDTTKWFFDNLIQTQHVQFDLVGESYYPFFHGPLTNLSTCLTNAAARYGKPVMVAETAYPWTNSVWASPVSGIPSTTNGQAQFVVALAQVVKSVPNNLSAGIFWWGAEYQKLSGVNEAGYNTTSFFDARGNVMPAANVFGQMVATVILKINPTNSALALQWPLSGAGMNLMTTTSLSPTAVWLAATNSVQTTNAIFNTTLPADASTGRFYRLQSK